MLWLLGTLLIVWLLVMAAAFWRRRRLTGVERPVHDGDLAPAMTAESVHIDLKQLAALTPTPPAVAAVKWAKLTEHTGGPTSVSGVVVYEPQRLTWAPDDWARSYGVADWQLPWSLVAGGSLRTATETEGTALTLNLTSGATIEFVGVEETSALRALRRLS